MDPPPRTKSTASIPVRMQSLSAPQLGALLARGFLVAELDRLQQEIACLQAQLAVRLDTGSMPSPARPIGDDGAGGVTHPTDIGRPGRFEYLSEENAGGRHVGRLKAKLPDNFEGKPELVKMFLRQLRTYFSYDATLDEESKIHMALDFCTGD